MPITSHAAWMRDTYSLTSPRSAFLKKVDAALASHERGPTAGNRKDLVDALDRWRFEQSKQGKDWRNSVRNQKGAVTALHRELTGVDKRNLTREDLEAMDFIARAQAMALMRQFDGKKLQFKSNTLIGIKNSGASAWQRFKTGASSVGSGASTVGQGAYAVSKIASGAKVLHDAGAVGAKAASSESTLKILAKIKEMCAELCPGLDPSKVFTDLGLGSVETFSVQLAPFVGAISSGGAAIVGWIGVIRKEYARIDMVKNRYVIARGDPMAAFNGMIELLDREINAQLIRASVKTAGFTGKAAGAFADFGAVTGPVIGLLELLAEVVQMVIEYVRDYKECQVANELLRLGALNLDLFTVCPILGCYFLVIQDHSTIINMAVGQYGTPNWMFDVEKMVGKLHPMLEKSRMLIKLSRLEIPGIEQSKGLAVANYSVATGLGKVSGLPGHIGDTISDKIAEWRGKPTKHPKVVVDRNRITGYGMGPRGGGPSG